MTIFRLDRMQRWRVFMFTAPLLSQVTFYLMTVERNWIEFHAWPHLLLMTVL